MDIHVLHRQGHSIRAISRQLGIARNTVRSYLRDLARTPTYGPREARSSKLDPFKPYLRDRIAAAKPHWIPATVLIPALNGGGTDSMSQREFALSDAAIVRLKHFQTIRFRSPVAGPDTGKGMTKIASAVQTMVLGHTQVQGHHLVAQTGVFDRSLVSGFDMQLLTLAVFAGWPSFRPGPYFQIFLVIYPFNFQLRYAYNCSSEGHRCSPLK